jgi:hypothetical protein
LRVTINHEAAAAKAAAYILYVKNDEYFIEKLIYIKTELNH